jgi:hypothetical protein
MKINFSRIKKINLGGESFLNVGAWSVKSVINKGDI